MQQDHGNVVSEPKLPVPSSSGLNLEMFQWVTASHIYWAIITCLWLEYFFALYLCIRQNKVYKNSREIPAPLRTTLDKETFEKARAYGYDKNTFSIFSEFYGMFVLTALLSFEGLYHGWQFAGPMLDAFHYWPESWDREIGQSIAFSILALIFNSIVGLPLSIYSTFVIEERHGFNKQTFGFFVKDFIKKNLVTILIMTPILGLIIKIVQAGGEYFFVYLWFFCFIVLLFMMTIYPVAIAPLFDKYTPLRDGPLKTRIENLAAKVNFPLKKLFVVEGSKRSAHSNAYMYGFFNNKRIVLFDTLIKGYVKESSDKEETEKEKSEADKKKEAEQGCSDEEIEAVLGHELGHWKLNHVLQNIIISQVNVFFIFAFFAFFYQNPTIYEAFGFPKGSEEKPILLGLMIVLQFLLQIYNTAMGYFMNVLSRRFEFQADDFARELGYRQYLCGALIKLNKDNLGFPVSDPLYSAWYHSHPTLLQRLAALDAAGDSKKQK